MQTSQHLDPQAGVDRGDVRRREVLYEIQFAACEQRKRVGVNRRFDVTHIGETFGAQ